MGVPGNANALLLRSAAAAGGYQVSRSLRFNSPDTPKLTRVFGSTGNRRTWTLSCWVKRSKLGTTQNIFQSSNESTADQYLVLNFDSSDRLFMGGGPTTYRLSTARFRDVSAWYHIVLTWDTTQATAADRVRLYVNGTQLTAFDSSTDPSQNFDGGINRAKQHNFGFEDYSSGVNFLDAYLAECHFIDGSAKVPGDFAETDATTGQWIPKLYSGSYGTNGFKLTFADNSAATAAALGKDTANSNNWTPNNFSVTAGAGNDSLVDTPTSYGTDTGAGGEVRGNYCTLNPLDISSLTTSDGNLCLAASAAGYVRGTMNLAGKTYWEVTITNAGLGGIIGIMQPNGAFPYTNSNGYHSGGTQYVNGSSVGSWGASWTTNDVIGIAVDANAGTITAYKNGASQGSKSISSTSTWMPWIHSYDGTNYVNFGQRPFAYTAPSGFKALCDTNLTAPVIAKSSGVMDVALYTGNGGTRTVSGLGFSPDFVWIKRRDAAGNHALFDIIRGTGKFLESSTTGAESTSANSLTAFNSDGFSLGTETQTNTNNATYVAWAFDAGTTTITSTAGSISSSCRTNQSSGFSIVTWSVGTAVNNSTIGHGLNAAPSLIICKTRTASNQNWIVYHRSLGTGDYLALESTQGSDTRFSTIWGTSAPTSTVFGVGNSGFSNNTSNNNYVAYCWAPVTGYSSAFSYTGTGNSDGPMVWLGFRPRLIVYKRTDSASNWSMYDSSRDSYNITDHVLAPNSSGAEAQYASDIVDLLSNGFKIRSTGTAQNASGGTYIGFAWAESPFQYARAR